MRRFRFGQLGYVCWHNRTGGGVLLPVGATARTPGTVAWRLILLWPLLVAPIFQGFQIGAYVVSGEGDPQLQGHSGIRY